MNRNIRILQNVMWGAFGLVFWGLVYWQLIGAGAILARDDNPRRVIAEQRIRRGQISTAGGVALAQTVTEADGLTRRRYPYPNLASVTGYYSVRYGTGGLEAAFDGFLRGEDRQSELDRLLHRPPVGQNITVTIQLPAQIAADTALAQANVTGAVLVMNAQSGEVLVMAGWPTFDPNTLDEQWDALVADPSAPLLNRATQGVFPLGELVRVVGMVGLFEAGATSPPEPLTAPLPEMLAPLGGLGLAATAHQLQFDRPLKFDLPSSAGLIPEDLPNKAGEIAATPLHVALMGAALLQDGTVPAPTLIYPVSPSAPPTRLLGIDTAAWVSGVVPEFEALASPEVTGSEPLSWYLGLQQTDPPLVTVVVVTTPQADRRAAAGIARATLKAIVIR